MLPHGENHIERTVNIPAGRVNLEGNLGIPEHARGIVVFAHGTGSSRFSPRNRYVARVLRDAEARTWRFEQALAHHLLAQLSEVDGQDAADHALRADRLFEELGVVRVPDFTPSSR